MNKIKEILKNETGSALVLSLMVLFVLSVLGGMVGVITIGSHKLADTTRDSNSAYYIAEAGANMAYEEMKSIVEQKYKDNETYDAFFTAMDTPLKNTEGLRATKKYAAGYFSPQMGDVPEADVKVTGGTIVESEGAQGKERVKNYIIESTGQVDGKTRTVEREVEITWRDKVKAGSNIPLPPSDAAITVNGYLTSSKIPTVNGKIYETDKVSFKIGHSKEDEDKFKKNNTFKGISGSDWDKLSEIDDVLARIPTYIKEDKENGEKVRNYIVDNTSETLPMTKNTYMPKLTIRNGGTLHVDTSGKSLTLFIDEMDIGGATINVVSGGNLTIVFTENKTVTINSRFKYNGSLVTGGDINFTSKPEIVGDVIASGHIEISGAIVTGDIISGKHITLKDGPNINGNIFAKNHIYIKASHSIVNGLIASTNNDVNVENDATLNSLVMAPNGNFSMQDRTALTGSVVAKTINFSNEVTVTRSLDYLKYLPGGAGSGAGPSEIGIDDLISSTPAVEN